METYYYVVTLSDNGTGIQFNSLVPEPAIDRNYELFSAVERTVKREEFGTDEEKRLITGPIMIPNKKILRAFSDGSGYYWCIFTEETIDIALKKWAKEGKFNNMSLNHWQPIEGFDTTKPASGIYLTEVYALNDRNKSELFSDLPNGTIIGTYWVEDVELWDKIKKSDFKGFSVEIVVDVKTEEEIKDGIFSALEAVLTDEKMSVESKRARIEDLFPLPSRQQS